jgi:SAM-dependent methyltransferase
MQTEVDTRAQGAALLAHVAGYVAHRTVAIGLRSGLVETWAEAGGATPSEVASRGGLDPAYVEVWARSAYAAGVLEREDDGYALAPHVAELLLDADSPAYVGGIFGVLEEPEVFDRFERVLPSGDRMWWSDTSHRWIEAVAATGRPFYTRLIPGGLAQVPGLTQVLQRGGRIVETACGTGTGLVRLATAYPDAEVLGIDGDDHSLQLAAKGVSDAGLADRVRLLLSPLEELDLDEEADLVVNNISMHECRDIDLVTENTLRALEPGGWFVISDFPFPDDVAELRSLPGRIMTGVQVFEAQIDDQLLPVSAYLDLLTRHGFVEIDTFQLTPVHAVTFGRRPPS